MFRPRVIPVLLLRNRGIVKSVRFKDYRYIGDPINAVKLFNDLGADELVFLDILANHENRSIPIDFVRRVGDEANMPFSVGGGLKSINEIKDVLQAGAEKVVLNTFAFENPHLINEAANEFGSSTIVVSIDVKKSIWGKESVFIYSGKKAVKQNPVDYAKRVEQLGAGEIIINSIENDGLMNGYDIELVRTISEAVRIPVVALGGAGNILDLKNAIEQGFASAVAAGSLFVYHGPRKAVLINYPTSEEMDNLFKF